MAAPVTFQPGDDARALRDIFGCFTTGVTVVTARGKDGSPVGFTANSFASVSLDPPLVLVCVDLTAASLPVLEAAGAFAVNVLHAGQRSLARRFTRKGADRFAEGGWEGAGAPVLNGAMAVFECETERAFDAGDHRVFIGRVVRARAEPDHEPLVFLRGGYCGAHVD